MLIVMAIGLVLANIDFMASVKEAIEAAMIAVAGILTIIAIVWAFGQVS